MKALTVISWVNFAVLLLLAAISFRVSFFAQAELVVDLGLADTVAEGAFWPIAIDGSLVGMGLAGVRQSLTGGALLRPLRCGILVVSLVSVSLNALHAPPNALARGVAIIPPVLLVTFLEILLGQLRETVRKSEARPTAEAVTRGTRVVTDDRPLTHRSVTPVTPPRDSAPPTVTSGVDATPTVTTEDPEVDTGVTPEAQGVTPAVTETEQEELVFEDRAAAIRHLRNQGHSLRSIGDALGVSRTTVSRVLSQAERTEMEGGDK